MKGIKCILPFDGDFSSQRRTLEVLAKTSASLMGGKYSTPGTISNTALAAKRVMNLPCGLVSQAAQDLMNKTRSLHQAEPNCSIVVASSTFNNYDSMAYILNEPTPSSYLRNTCYFLFVDYMTCVAQNLSVSTKACQVTEGAFVAKPFKWKVWNVIVLDLCRMGLSEARRASRLTKMLAHRLFPDALFFIHIDGNRKLLTAPREIISTSLILPNKTFAALSHPWAHRGHLHVWDEIREVQLRGRVDDEGMIALKAQAQRMRDDNLGKIHEPKVHDMGFFAWNMQDPSMQVAMCSWFDEFNRGGTEGPDTFEKVVEEYIVVKNVDTSDEEKYLAKQLPKACIRGKKVWRQYLSLIVTLILGGKRSHLAQPQTLKNYLQIDCSFSYISRQIMSLASLLNVNKSTIDYCGLKMFTNCPELKEEKNYDVQY
eukprot:UC4_evm3s44